MKPREWIIFGVACAEKGSAAYDNFQWNEGNVHVIEKSAYDRLEAMCESLRKELDELKNARVQTNTETL